MKNDINKVIKNVTLNESGAIYVNSHKVFCEGSLEYSTHPRVFLQIPHDDNKNEIKCPYCSQIFIYKTQGYAK